MGWSVFPRHRRDGRAALLGLALVAAGAGRARADQFVKEPYLQNAAPRSVTVMWEWDRAEPAVVTVIGAAGERRIAVPPRARQEVVIDGLEPGRRYRYQVEVAGHRAAGELTTAPEVGSPSPLTFVVFGDTRSHSDAHRQLIERIRAEVPDFVLGTGDLVDEGHDLRQWQVFFDVEGPLLRDNVLFPALGNHDRQGRGRTADNYRSLFAVPDNGSDPERVYAFTWGPARFVVLDSNAHSFALTDQTGWLERELAAARQDPHIRQVFVVMHHPPFSISLHGGQRDLRERWTPLFERYGVTAVFSGHDHCYERAEMGGIRYFVSGGGGAALYPRSRRPSEVDLEAVQRFERTSHYLRVHVVGDMVEVTAVRADGTPIETTTWGEPPRLPPVNVGAALPPAPTVTAAPVAARAMPPGGRWGWPVLILSGLGVMAAAVLLRLVRR